MLKHLQGEAGVVVGATRLDAGVLLGTVEGAEDEDGDGEEDEAEGLIVHAEDEAGAVTVEALVDLLCVVGVEEKKKRRRKCISVNKKPRAVW